jgi:hypothetical protein
MGGVVLLVRRAVVPALVVAIGVLTASAVPTYAGRAVTLPPTGSDWDYQLGGARSVPGHVGVVERDRHASPVSGKDNVCYVKGFQTQVDESRFWRRHHWRLVLHDHGSPVVDSVWGEWLLDTRTGTKRRALARIVGRWTDRCAADGFDAVEYDNLDSFSRSHHLVTRTDNKRYAALLVAAAHSAGLAAAQKNWAQWDGTSVGFDFAVAEQCGQYRECGSYVDHYDAHVLAVEYRAKAFRRTCRHWSDRIAVVRRDVDLTRTGLRRWCP